MKPRILILDNFDSFTYNLVHYFEPHCKEVQVIRNDVITFKKINTYDKIILSPGPGLPKNAGKMMSIIDHFYKKKPILGVCLGMQALGEYFGGRLENLTSVFHGVSSSINIVDSNDYLYKNVPKNIQVGRYHSWVVSKTKFPSELIITSEDEAKNIMSFRHHTYDIQGVQYHPESILTEHGLTIIKNWIHHVD